MRTQSILIIFIFLLTLAFSCDNAEFEKSEVMDSTLVQGDLIIFHASSMTHSLTKIIHGFEVKYPHVKVLAEGSGSRKAARKIIERNRQCDILISSDYQVIKNLLMPNYTDWYLEFASNEMVIAYTKNSTQHKTISQDNWYKILLSNEVHFGRANPDYDPSGYRAVICIKLAEKYYGEYGIKDQLLFKDKKYIFAKDTDLANLLKTQKIDYAFVYKSIALQWGFDFIELPDQINLKSMSQSSYYAMAKTKINGKNPGKYIEYRGAPIRYALTQIRNAPNPRAAEAFLSFFISSTEGLKALKDDKMNVLDSVFIRPSDSTTLQLRKHLGLM